MKEIFSWGGHVPNVLPQPTGLTTLKLQIILLYRK